MGYRAQVVKTHREYGSSIFSDWQQFDDYYRVLVGEYPDELYADENTDFYEIPRESIEKEIKRLEKLGRDEPFEIQPTWTGPAQLNGEIIDAWGYALEESPKESEYVQLEWY